MANVQKDLGPVSAYAIAVKHGYQGTEEEWAALQIAAAENAAAAAQSAKAAADTLEAVEETVNQETTQAVQAVKDQETASIESVEAAASAAGAAQDAAIAAKGAETLESIPSEYAALAEQVNQNTTDLLTKAPAIECEASGSLVTVTDAAAQPAVQLVTHIEPVQEGEGDPSPDNVRPIRGWDKATLKMGGVNLFDKSQKVANRYISAGGTIINNDSWLITGAIPVVGGRSVTYRGLTEVGSLPISAWYDAELQYISDFKQKTGTNTVFAPQNARYLKMSLQIASGDVETLIVTVGDALPDNYIPYQDAKALIADLPETVHGGTVDWGTGVLTVDREAQIFKGAETFSDEYAQTYGFYHVVNSNVKIGRAVCNCFTTTQVQIPVNGAIRFHTVDLFPSLEEWNKFVSDQYAAGTPIIVVYFLRTPYTIQLAPRQLTMLRGTTNLWSDTGDTDLVYVADTKSYIDNKIAAIAAAIVNGSPTA